MQPLFVAHFAKMSRREGGFVFPLDCLCKFCHDSVLVYYVDYMAGLVFIALMELQNMC